MKLTPSQQALKYAAAAGNASGAHLSDGDLSFFAAMLDVAVDAVRKGKPTPLGVTTSFIRAELATPDLINDRSINSKAIQCAADVGELAVALGAFGTSAAAASATAGMASPAVLVSGAGLVAQVFSTTVSCGSVAVDLTGAALVEVTEHFKAVSASISGLVAKCIEELNKNTEKHFKPENVCALQNHMPHVERLRWDEARRVLLRCDRSLAAAVTSSPFGIGSIAAFLLAVDTNRLGM